MFVQTKYLPLASENGSHQISSCGIIAGEMLRSSLIEKSF